MIMKGTELQKITDIVYLQNAKDLKFKLPDYFYRLTFDDAMLSLLNKLIEHIDMSNNTISNTILKLYGNIKR